MPERADESPQALGSAPELPTWRVAWPSADKAALAIFDILTALCRDQLSELQRAGMLRQDLDLEWAALHTVLINLGTVIMEPSVSRELGRPFLARRQVERWKQAATALFVDGELRDGERLNQ